MSLLCSSTILVNNATYFVVIDFRSINANILDSHYGINIRGTCLLTVELARQIEGKHDGRFINMVSGQEIIHLSLEIWLMLQQIKIMESLNNQNTTQLIRKELDFE